MQIHGKSFPTQTVWAKIGVICRAIISTCNYDALRFALLKRFPTPVYWSRRVWLRRYVAPGDPDESLVKYAAIAVGQGRSPTASPRMAVVQSLARDGVTAAYADSAEALWRTPAVGLAADAARIDDENPPGCTNCGSIEPVLCSLEVPWA